MVNASLIELNRIQLLSSLSAQPFLSAHASYTLISSCLRDTPYLPAAVLPCHPNLKESLQATNMSPEVAEHVV
jgi:hypothetical protein